MVHFTDKSIVITLPTNYPFQDYVALQNSLFEVLTFVIKSSHNEVGEIDSIYPLEVFTDALTTIGNGQDLEIERFIRKQFEVR
jgi:hypothetical protein